MKINNIKGLKLSLLLATCLVPLASGCTKSGPASMPAFVGADDGGGEPDGGSHGVDEQLAREAGQERIIYHVGPVDLPAGTSVGAMLEKPLIMRFQTDRPVWVVGFEPRVVDEHGSELPAELLHHAIVSNMHEENDLCSDAAGGNPFFIATSMLTDIELPRGYGYPILATDPLEARAMLANPTDENFAGVYFELTIVTRPMNEFVNLADIKPMLLEIEPCGHKPLEIEPNTFAERYATYRVPKDSDLIMAFGVLEDYGASIALTSGKETMPFWRAEALLDEGHRVVGLEGNPFEDPAGKGFESGDSITLSVAYDNFSESWLSGATAGAMVYLAPR